MGRVDVANVDRYIDRQPAGVRGALRQVREAIRKALPDAEESISYGMPTYKQGGRPVVYFAGWTRHCSVYPVTPAVRAAIDVVEAPLEFHRGTLRIPFSVDIPGRLVATFAAVRAEEVAATSRPPVPGVTRARTTPARGRTNAGWHRAHRLARGAPLDERVRWHVAHAEACGCRPMPSSVRAALAASRATTSRRSSGAARSGRR